MRGQNQLWKEYTQKTLKMWSRSRCVVRMKKACVLSYPLSAQRSLWADWTDAQAELSLCWAHSRFVGFVVRRLNLTLLGMITIVTNVNNEVRQSLFDVNHLRSNMILHDPKKVNWKLNFIGVPCNQTFDFVTVQFVKILTPACLWRFVKNVDNS